MLSAGHIKAEQIDGVWYISKAAFFDKFGWPTNDTAPKANTALKTEDGNYSTPLNSSQSTDRTTRFPSSRNLERSTGPIQSLKRSSTKGPHTITLSDKSGPRLTARQVRLKYHISHARLKLLVAHGALSCRAEKRRSKNGKVTTREYFLRAEVADYFGEHDKPQSSESDD